MAATTIDEIRRAFCSTPSGRGMYVEQIEVDPLQLIAAEPGSESRYRVPVSANSGGISFGEPVPVVLVYEDSTPAEVAASALTTVRFERWATSPMPVGPAATSSGPRAPTMTPDDAVRTGRITQASFAGWQQRFAADPAGVGEVLASLYPVLADDPEAEVAAVQKNSRAGTGDDLDAEFDAEYAHLFPRTAEQVDRRLRVEAAAWDREIAAQEQLAAQTELTDDEIRRLFGE